MKYLTLFVLATFLILGCKKEDDEMIVEEPTPSGPIVLLNTGVESVDHSGIPVDWWYRAGPYQLFTTDTTAFSGNVSAGIFSDSLSADFGFWSQSTNENIQAGKKLRLRVNIKTENVVGEGASIVIRGDNTIVPQGPAELFASTQGDIFIGGTHNWKEYRVELEEPISPTIRSITIFVVLLPYTTGTIFMDEVQLSYL